MTPTVFFAVLFAALLHAGWNALIKLGLDRFSAVLFLALVQGAIEGGDVKDIVGKMNATFQAILDKEQ